MNVAVPAHLAKTLVGQTQFCLASAKNLTAHRAMDIQRRHFLTGATSVLAGACVQRPAPVPAPIRPLARPRLPAAPLRISEDRLMRITVCTRPFRPAGPRIEAERFDETKVIHNYGHGGSGWSLSWACAEEAVSLAGPVAGTPVAVIGAGVIGLTTALRLAQSGAAVTIYAAQLPHETRSARATGVWSPSSRIGLGSAVADGFGARWEHWARSAYATHQQFIGTVGSPVSFVPFYNLRSHDPSPRVPEQHDFLHLGHRLGDLWPGRQRLDDGAHAFPVAAASRTLDLSFNIAAYTDRLVRDVLALGGRMIRKTFETRAEVLSLPQPILMNCTGFGAKTLWGADELVPVRGQINWMPPQPEALYGLYYDQVYVLSRGDGIVVQYTGPNDDYGYGVEDETPDRDEMRQAVAKVGSLFKGWGA